MKRILMIAVALCFVLSGTIENFAQKRKPTKKPARKKLVRCYENGKRVYRTKCRTPQITNPELVIIPQTTNKKAEKTEENPYGLSNGIGNGQGTGGGMGTGRGRGYGNGDGVGNGSGNGNTTEENFPKVVTPNAGLITPLKILSKPRAQYTDAARQNNVQGTIVLRITFLANGSIGSISVVKGLGYGLNENAIAAAKQIRFEPAKKNGVPYAVTKSVNFNFVIY